MEAIFIYFLKANGLLVTFFLSYYFLLRKETFFNKNRWFLLLGLLTSVLLPLLTFTKTIWIDPSPVVYETVSNDNIPYVIVNQIEEIPFDWNTYFIYAYALIALVFLAKMFIQLFSFFRIIKFGNRSKKNQTILIDTNQNTNPFSFFNHIVFNSRMFTKEELQHIISHENIHVKEKHSIDVLVSKVFSALFWINPIMWFYQKEILQNLEYIADDKASTIAQDKINYQKTLLKVVTNQHQLSITNQFYQSLIKKRIVMLNTNPSNQRKSWKYALILPVLSVFMLLFQVETMAQVKENSSNINKTATKSVAVAVGFVTDKNATDAEMKLDTEELKKQGIDYKFSKIKRNKKGEIIAIKIEFNDNNGNNGVKVINGKDPIDPIYFSTENEKIGFTNEPDLSGFVVDEKLSKQFGTEIKVKMNTSNEVKNNSNEAAKLTKNEDYQFVTTTFDIYDTNEMRFQIKNEIVKENEKALYLFNNKEISIKEAKNIKGEQISEIIEILSSALISNYGYGEKGKNGVIKINSEIEKPNSERNRLYIINGKEYLQSEIPKGTTVEVDGSISELSKEEGIKKYGQKAKDGVLIFNGKSTFVKDSKIIPNVKIIKEDNSIKQTNQVGYVFDKISSDKEFENDFKTIKEKYNIDVKVLRKKRNNKGELIELKLSFNDNNGIIGKTEQIRNIPIRPIFLKINMNSNGKNEIGFFDNHEMILKPKDAVMENKISIIENLNDNAIIYVDGNLFSKEEVNELDVNGLKSIKVLKDKESLKKYKITDQKEVTVIETNWKTKK
ncbi:M56 family metallopeptidase [uncultured Flavobacterium sp.]|uniref:M56 family metallopeptidase n=1 Tax=uncultured Flavobacterium sp. TaxID=165435 RepID=UPI0030EEC5F3